MLFAKDDNLFIGCVKVLKQGKKYFFLILTYVFTNEGVFDSIVTVVFFHSLEIKLKLHALVRLVAKEVITARHEVQAFINAALVVTLYYYRRVFVMVVTGHIVGEYRIGSTVKHRTHPSLEGRGKIRTVNRVLLKSLGNESTLYKARESAERV